MNSKGTEPRVGMQVRSKYSGYRFNVSKIDGASLTDSFGFLFTGGCAWRLGAYEIEWIPPTDEEREMFRRASEHESKEFCKWSDMGVTSRRMFVTWAECKQVAESLSMDGL